MYKKILLVIILLILLIGLGGLLLHHKSNQPIAMKATTTPVAMKQTHPITQEGSLKSLLALGGAKKCTFSNSDTQNSVSGTVYVSDGKMRGDFLSKSVSANVTGHMIMDSGYMYIWNDETNQGMKMAFNPNQEITPVPNHNSQAPNLNQSVSYSCGSWSADQSMFAIPTNITFSSITIPSGVPSTSGANASSGNSVSCSTCNAIPAGPGRDACRAQLHC
jgi:hypothetical protein